MMQTRTSPTKTCFGEMIISQTTRSSPQNYPPSLFGNGRINPTQNLVDAFPMKNGYPISNTSSGFNPAAPYSNRGPPRLAYFILYNGASLRSTTINTSVNSPTADGLNKTPNYSTRTGYYLLKWLRVNINMDPAKPTTARHFYHPRALHRTLS
ncbi:MAG: RagB/SusD family nutrient uptake outer membrane protein [Mangrovibacterium sp.]